MKNVSMGISLAKDVTKLHAGKWRKQLAVFVLAGVGAWGHESRAVGAGTVVAEGPPEYATETRGGVAVPRAPTVARLPSKDTIRGSSSRRGVLLRSNVGLSRVRVRGVREDDFEYESMQKWRFATMSYLSMGYGWRSNFALTIDAFRQIVPHYPHDGQKARFQMQVDTEVLGLGLGSTTFYPPLSLHWGQSIGYVLARVGGGIISAPDYRGVGSMTFVGHELMRSERIGIVLSAQVFQVLAYGSDRLFTSRSYGMALGVTYW